MSTDGRAAALDRLERWPRARLVNAPTPLLAAPRLAEALGADDLLVKMDAETGFALGGNKVRKLEMELEESRLAGTTCLITAGGPQSNHCRVTAAFAARAGLRCILVTQAPEPDHPTGNALLHRLFGAEIHTVPDRDGRVSGMEEAAAAVRHEGGRPLVLPIGASTGLGSLGYALAARELVEQLDRLPPADSGTRVFVSTSSCGTLAGLALGLALLDRSATRLVAVSADSDAGTLRAETKRIVTDGADLLGWQGVVDVAGIDFDDGQVGAGYGVPTDASNEALSLFARREGIVLDPTYTAKAGAGMIDWIRRHRAQPEERIVFLHTGGHPGLLA